MKNILLALALVVGLISCEDNKSEYDATGAFETTEIMVSAEANGKLLVLGQYEGMVVEPGIEMGYIDSMQLFYQKEQLRCQLGGVDARKPDLQKQISIIEQQLGFAKSELQRAENIVKSGAGNQIQVDDWQSRVNVLESQLAAQRSTLSKTTQGADAEIESIQYKIMQLDDQIQKCIIRSPIKGIVLTQFAEQGEFVTMGKPLFKVANMDVLYLRAYVQYSDLTKLELGQEVSVYADYGDGRKEYPGRITWVSSESEFTPKGIQTKNERESLVYAIKIAVENDGYLKIGQYGEVKF